MTKLRVYYLSDVFKFNYNRTVIPAVVIFKYKKLTFYFEYKKYHYRSKEVKKTRYAIHSFSAEINNIKIIKGKKQLIPKDMFLDAFKRKNIKVLGIALLDEQNHYKPLISTDFLLDDEKGYGVEIVIDDVEYSNVKLDKDFKFLTR